MDNESHQIIMDMRDDPEGMVTVYRAVPKNVDVINPGDWVTINRDYAEMHGEGTLQGDYHIIEDQVQAQELYTEGNSLNEWGWNPGNTQDLPAGVQVQDGIVQVSDDIQMLPASEGILQQFLPASPEIDFMDFKDLPMFILPADRLGVGPMEIGEKGKKIKMPIDAMGGRGFTYLSPNHGWAFTQEGTANTFLKKAKEYAVNGRVIAAVTTMGDQTHMNSPYGRLAMITAYEHAINSGAVPRSDVNEQVASTIARIKESESKNKDFVSLKKKLTGVKNLQQLKKLFLNPTALTFPEAAIYMEKSNLKKSLHMPFLDANEKGIAAEGIARDLQDPGLVNTPMSHVVALFEVDLRGDPKPMHSKRHYSYPWEIKGHKPKSNRPIGFLKKHIYAGDLYSGPKHHLSGNPAMQKLPLLDKASQYQELPVQASPAMRPSVNYPDLVRPKTRTSPPGSIATPAMGEELDADALYQMLLRN